jgi:cbb3-type cytochrome oxidase cytochrome c subunit
MVIIPVLTMDRRPSSTWRPWTAQEQAGHDLFVSNGCSYCHSQFIRVFDWDLGAERIAASGDYAGQTPAILGTERTGPDLSQAGGEHPDDWHVAHFTNPRFTRPQSIMPSWEFLGPDNIRNLIAYIQAEGGTNADARVARQLQWKQAALEVSESTPQFVKPRQTVDDNVQWLHSQVPETWRHMPNPYPATEAGLARGKLIYQQFCINCHGAMGDGNGAAAQYLKPKPLNFTTLRRHLVDGKYIGGIFYYQIMNGITGTAMPYFKRELESEKIWDVSNYVAVMFLGYTDATMEPRGIEAAYQPQWQNTYTPPEPPKGEQ